MRILVNGNGGSQTAWTRHISPDNISLWIVSGCPPAHWFFTVEEPARSSPPRTAVHRSGFLSCSTTPYSLLSDHQHSPHSFPASFFNVMILLPFSPSFRFSLTLSTQLTRFLLFDGFLSISLPTKRHTCTWRRRCQGDCAARDASTVRTFFCHHHLLTRDPSYQLRRRIDVCDK